MKNNWPSHSFAWWTLGLICLCLCLFICLLVTLGSICAMLLWPSYVRLRTKEMLTIMSFIVSPACFCLNVGFQRNTYLSSFCAADERRPMMGSVESGWGEDRGGLCAKVAAARRPDCKSAKLHCILNPSALQLLHYCAAQIALHLLYLSANVHWSLLYSYF